MRKVWTFLIAIILTITVIPVIIDIAPSVEAPTIYVDDDNTGPEDGSQANPWNTIQEAVDAANPGDTVFVSNGTYYEDVVIDKTINLTGISRDNTTINASTIGILVQNIDYVNISGFKIVNGSSSGIRFIPSNNSIIENNRIERNGDGLEIADSNNTVIRNNLVIDNSGGGNNGIHILRSINLIIQNNICIGNSNGIYLHPDCNNNWIIGNNCSGNGDGIYLSTASNFNNYIGYNNISSINYGIADFSGNGNIYINNRIQNCAKGFSIYPINDIQIINSSIKNSTIYDIRVSFPDTLLTAINTTFNKSKVEFGSTTSKLDVQWFLHINIIDYLGNPVPNAKVKIEDNLNGSYNEIFVTDVNGYIKWLPITEYIEQDPDGDTIGNKINFTPHRIIVWNDTLVGYAQPIMDKSKTITIVLYNGTLIDLKPGWNLISLPRIQVDTNLQTVLQSIENQYDAVQWYNITDNNDHWKHYHNSKLPFMNDLIVLNHTKGFWLHIINTQVTTLIVFGNEFIINQNISLYPGWNHVGFPSRSNKTRDIALGTLNFGSDVDSIWTYNTSIQKWIELSETTNYFEIGKGYWMHSRVTKVWNVPL